MRALDTMPQEQFEAAVGLVMSHHPGLQVGGWPRKGAARRAAC